MNLTYLEEPFLQFADGEHIDIRAGITESGALDRDSQALPRPIRVGIVGTTETADRVRQWVEGCAAGVSSTAERLRELRPDFPGMTRALFGTELEFTTGATRCVSAREISRAIQGPALSAALFYEHARDVSDGGKTDVLVIAPPSEVFDDIGSPVDGSRSLDKEAPPTEATTDSSFHDLFKAHSLTLSVPCQVIRPRTYVPGPAAKGSGAGGIQDEATRAWNFHTALYYKAGGVPWRLVRDPAALTALFVGVSFFRGVDGSALLTSVAQVFDERGDGVVVQGASPYVKEDRSPHLAPADAQGLLLDAVRTYRREHRTSPARIVIHKTSYFDDGEDEGFKAAADEERIEVLELVNLRRSGIRLLRTGTFPVLRGTVFTIDEKGGVVYLRGSVPQYQTYPGMYLPAGIEFNRRRGESSVLALASELLSLSKLNFNTTQFDGGHPITVRASRLVGSILRHADPARAGHVRFRFFT